MTLEYCEKIKPGVVYTRSRATGKKLIYVCLNCGRRSWDLLGANALTSGWSQSCTKAAVRLPSEALKIDRQGLVSAVRRSDILALRNALLD